MNNASTGYPSKSKTPYLDKIRGWHKDAEPSEDELAFEKRLSDTVNYIVETIAVPMFWEFIQNEQKKLPFQEMRG